MSEGEHVAIARLGLWQAIIAALIAGLCGVLGSYFQLAAQQPATAGEIVETFDRRLPVGTIVASALDPTRFGELAGDPGDFDTSESVWVPADGRYVEGSAYAKYGPSKEAKVPDLRGMFLRGLDKKGQTDPDGARREVLSVQLDDFKKHTHSYPTAGKTSGNWRGSGDSQYRLAYHTPDAVGPAGGSETRPKNVAVYYYIKIN